MYLTVKESMQLMCPARTSAPQEILCIGVACMGWRWKDPEPILSKARTFKKWEVETPEEAHARETENRLGYCGYCGKPEE